MAEAISFSPLLLNSPTRGANGRGKFNMATYATHDTKQTLTTNMQHHGVNHTSEMSNLPEITLSEVDDICDIFSESPYDQLGLFPEDGLFKNGTEKSSVFDIGDVLCKVHADLNGEPVEINCQNTETQTLPSFSQTFSRNNSSEDENTYMSSLTQTDESLTFDNGCSDMEFNATVPPISGTQTQGEQNGYEQNGEIPMWPAKTEPGSCQSLPFTRPNSLAVGNNVPPNWNDLRTCVSDSQTTSVESMAKQSSPVSLNSVQQNSLTGQINHQPETLTSLGNNMQPPQIMHQGGNKYGYRTHSVGSEPDSPLCTTPSSLGASPLVSPVCSPSPIGPTSSQLLHRQQKSIVQNTNPPSFLSPTAPSPNRSGQLSPLSGSSQPSSPSGLHPLISPTVSPSPSSSPHSPVSQTSNNLYNLNNLAGRISPISPHINYLGTGPQDHSYNTSQMTKQSTVPHGPGTASEISMQMDNRAGKRTDNSVNPISLSEPMTNNFSFVALLNDQQMPLGQFAPSDQTHAPFNGFVGQPSPLQSPNSPSWEINGNKVPSPGYGFKQMQSQFAHLSASTNPSNPQVTPAQRTASDFQQKVKKDSKTAKQMFRCELCEREFEHSIGLKNHERSHRQDRNHACRYCKEVFHYKTQLKRHERIHARALHMCRYCGETQGSDYDLVQHERKHRKEDAKKKGAGRQTKTVKSKEDVLKKEPVTPPPEG